MESAVKHCFFVVLWSTLILIVGCGGDQITIDDDATVPRGTNEKPCTTDDDCQNLKLCTGHEVCIKSVCFPGSGVDLLDNLQCTDDLCDPMTGIITHPPVKVDDGNVCTLDGCTEGVGIWHQPLTEGACSPPVDCHPPPQKVLDISGTSCGSDEDCFTDYMCYYGGCDLPTNTCVLYPALVGSPCGDGAMCDMNSECCSPL